MAYTKQILYDKIRSIDSATFTGSYQAVGTALTFPASIIKLVNNSGVAVTVSTDGVNDNDVAPANSFFLYDLTANTPTHGDDAVFLPVNTQFYVKGASSTGLVYLVVMYVKQV
jgi:hypothetical protein